MYHTEATIYDETHPTPAAQVGGLMMMVMVSLKRMTSLIINFFPIPIEYKKEYFKIVYTTGN
jgi:hypothetical protein